MKVVKIENMQTRQFYYAAVEDNDGRLDPLGLFGDTFYKSKHRPNVKKTLIKRNVSKEVASAAAIIGNKQSTVINKIRKDVSTYIEYHLPNVSTDLSETSSQEPVIVSVETNIQDTSGVEWVTFEKINDDSDLEIEDSDLEIGTPTFKRSSKKGKSK